MPAYAQEADIVLYVALMAAQGLDPGDDSIGKTSLAKNHMPAGEFSHSWYLRSALALSIPDCAILAC